MINCKTSSFRAITLNDQTIAFQIKGKFGKDVNRELREEIMTALKGFQQNVIIDLTRVDNIDTSAVALLVECIRFSETTNTSFKVLGINNKVKEIFEMMKLSTIFDNLELYQIPRTEDHILYRSKIA